MDEAKIRSAVVDDCERLAAVFSAYLEEQGRFDTYQKLHPRFNAQQLIRVFLQSGNQKFFVAEQDGQLKGFIRVVMNIGGHVVAFQPSELHRLKNRLSPLRVVRKLSLMVFNWASPRTAAAPVFDDIKTGYIADMYVVREHRRKGLGAKLVAASLGWFKGNGISLVYLQAFEENEAGVNFWRGLGFSTLRFVMRKEI